MSSKISSKSLANGKSANKVLEESNLKVLRELSHIAGNRHCFDCGQRGPTYVNVTIGSFVCMACSGLLRGLTPPHRVKSISMASFLPEEIELLKSRGNDYCRKVWLATCATRDSYIGSDKDPDRLNSLRSFMSAKYEQKRFYIDPSKLPQSELQEIQAQTAKALSSSTSFTSQNGSCTTSSTMQKSPSLSSASSASSLSLQSQSQNQNHPSPILNNSRSQHHHNHNGQIINSQPQPQTQNRLVNSITLPDIMPLSSLLGPGSGSVNLPPPTSSSNTNTSNHVNMNGSKSNNFGNGMPASSTPVPINFINNFSTTTTTKGGAVNGGVTNDPWESDNNNFNANFADFDAFNENGGSGGNGGGSESNDLNFANFDAFQSPLLPANNSFGGSGNGGGGGGDNLSSRNMPPPLSTTSNEDKYAALKDLDNIFKQGINDDVPTTGNGFATTGTNGLSSSASFPTNLSSSSGTSAAAAWFASSPNQQRQGTNPSSGVANGGWTVNGANNGHNPRNPFFNNVPSWQAPPSVGNSLFSTSPSASCFQTVGSTAPTSNGFSNPLGVVNGTATANGLFSNGTHASSSGGGGIFSSNHLNPVSSSTSATSPFNKVANPFYSAMPAPSVNPNNPFL